MNRSEKLEISTTYRSDRFPRSSPLDPNPTKKEIMNSQQKGKNYPGFYKPPKLARGRHSPMHTTHLSLIAIYAIIGRLLHYHQPFTAHHPPAPASPSPAPSSDYPPTYALQDSRSFSHTDDYAVYPPWRLSPSLRHHHHSLPHSLLPLHYHDETAAAAAGRQPALAAAGDAMVAGGQQEPHEHGASGGG